MHSSTLIDLGRHAGRRAGQAVNDVAELVDNLEEGAVIMTYVAGAVCAQLVATVIAVERQRRGSAWMADEAFVRSVIAEVADISVPGILLGQKQMESER